MEKVKLSRTGHLELPLSLLNIHQWTEGTEFIIQDKGTELVVKPITKFLPSQLESPDTPSVYTGKPLSLDDMEAAIEEEAGRHV